ncbi:hypothetical protein MRX96_019388 [Rhipicephalus microplus]
MEQETSSARAPATFDLPRPRGVPFGDSFADATVVAVTRAGPGVTRQGRASRTDPFVLASNLGLLRALVFSSRMAARHPPTATASSSSCTDRRRCDGPNEAAAAATGFPGFVTASPSCRRLRRIIASGRGCVAVRNNRNTQRSENRRCRVRSSDRQAFRSRFVPPPQLSRSEIIPQDTSGGGDTCPGRPARGDAGS